MTRTITALFDARADAEAAKERLTLANIDADNISIHDKSSEGYSDTKHSTREEPGLWASIKNAFLPDHDRHTYEEGVRRGGVLLTADVGEDAVADAVQVLEDANTVDIDARAEAWKSSGWNYEAAAGVTGAERSYDANPELGSLSDAPSVYGRRELDRGGARARSYVSEPYPRDVDTASGTTDHAHADRGLGARAHGLMDEAIGNTKQVAGDLFGKDDLKRDGLAQERRGEAEQGKGPDKSY